LLLHLWYKTHISVNWWMDCHHLIIYLVFQRSIRVDMELVIR
jgi:hypothetical protein